MWHLLCALLCQKQYTTTAPVQSLLSTFSEFITVSTGGKPIQHRGTQAGNIWPSRETEIKTEKIREANVWFWRASVSRLGLQSWVQTTGPTRNVSWRFPEQLTVLSKEATECLYSFGLLLVLPFKKVLKNTEDAHVARKPVRISCWKTAAWNEDKRLLTIY